jgi:hypothetical protein
MRSASTLARSSVSRAAAASAKSAPGHVGERLAAPAEQRVPQDTGGFAAGQRVTALASQPLESSRVDRVGRHGQTVPGRVGLDHVADPALAQFGPQPGDQRLQRVARVARRVVGPDMPGQ